MVKSEELQNRIFPHLDDRVRFVREHVLPARGQHCGHCFGEGRDAALYEIEHGSPEPGVPHEKGERVKAAQTAGPRGITDVHCGHCFALGRELALKALEEWKLEEHPRPGDPARPGHELPKPGEPAMPGHELPGAQPPGATTKPGETPSAKPVHLPKTP